MNSTVCVLTAYTSTMADMAALSVPHMREYASRHKYDFLAIERDDCSRRGTWVKIETIRETLAAGFNFILWLDVDILVIRKDMDVRSAVQRDADLHMVWHDLDHISPPIPSHFNAGVMLIRVSDWARQFFMRVWETSELPHVWADQAAILHLLGYDDILRLGPSRPDEPNRERVARMDIAWNSIPGIGMADDPIIHHFAGVGDYETRLKLMMADEKTLDLRAQTTPEIRQAFSWQLNECSRILLKMHRDREERLNSVHAALAEMQTLAVERAQEIASLGDRLNRTHAALAEMQAIAVERAHE